MLEKAITIAVKAHEGQVDKNGEIYILHPLRVMMSLYGEDDRICGVLHDVIEDTDITLDYLKSEGFNECIIDILKLLTRNEHETYDEFIDRILVSSMACSVKKADLEDNMNENRMYRLDNKTKTRLLNKYEKALQKINNRFTSGVFL